MMKAKQCGEQHKFHFVFLGNKNNKKKAGDKTPETPGNVSANNKCVDDRKMSKTSPL